MRDPYATLQDQLRAAARRLEQPAGGAEGLRAWLSRRINAWVLALVALLSGGAVALAATGILSGAPVAPEHHPSATAGNGLPVRGAQLGPAITVPDPAGGLPWGARIFRTTRGQACIQVGRVKAGQLGLLGLDSAFGSDGRFHALPANALPPGYGGPEGQGECVPIGATVMSEDAHADRSADRLLPEEFDAPPAKHRTVPPTADQRTLAYGLLGPHALSVTYRTPSGLRTVPVTGREGAFLIVEPAGYIESPSLVGGSVQGQANASSVLVLGPALGARPTSIVVAATFRFGAHTCSVGTGAAVTAACPQRRVEAPRSAFEPTRDLGQPVSLTLLRQTPAACRRAFLLIPCYQGQIRFTAPYSITNASADYSIDSLAKCRVGGRPEGGWSLERDVARGEHIRADELGLFVFTPSCASHEIFRVEYINTHGPSRAAPHASVIVGSVSVAAARLPGGGKPLPPTSP